MKKEYIKKIYLSEIETQANFAINAIENLNQMLKLIHDLNLDKGKRTYVHKEIFRNIHSFLVHSSIISKILWPPPPLKKKKESLEDYKKRKDAFDKKGEELCKLLRIPKNHLIKDRELRNHLEHFNEHLMDWERNSSNLNFFQDTVGPKNAISGINPSNAMRWFDPTTNLFFFRGKSYDLQKMVKALEEIINSLNDPRLLDKNKF